MNLLFHFFFQIRTTAISREGNQRSGRQARRKYKAPSRSHRSTAEKMCRTEATFHEHGRCYAKRH